MAYSAQYLRDLLSLAKTLRRFVDLHGEDANHDLFITAAGALDVRAHHLATVNGDLLEVRHDAALRAPVNQLV